MEAKILNLSNLLVEADSTEMISLESVRERSLEVRRATL